jgi:hypothetical protein
MPLIVKGETIVTSVEKKPSPPVKVVKVEPVVVRQEVKETVVELPSHYHHEVDGDLHKLINKKSDYLVDMLDFDSNK